MLAHAIPQLLDKSASNTTTSASAGMEKATEEKNMRLRSDAENSLRGTFPHFSHVIGPNAA